jgi:hypothetical protein
MTAGLLNPKLGCNNVIDDISGRKIRSDEVMITWEGFVTCAEDYDPKHPQIELKSRSDNERAKIVRDRPEDVFNTYVNPNSL